jgi:hypothetical protein
MYTDPAAHAYLPEGKAWEYATAVCGAFLVLGIARIVQTRRAAKPDLA